MLPKKWSGRQDSNLRPSVPKTDALPGCATPRVRVLLGDVLVNAKGKALGSSLFARLPYVLHWFTLAEASRRTAFAKSLAGLPAEALAKAGGPGGTRTPDLAVMSGQL